MEESAKERAMIFIDGSNFYHGLKECRLGTSVDFGKLVEFLAGERRLIRTYYYNAPVNQQDDPERYKRQERFFEKLRRIPYFEIKLGRLQRKGNTLVEKGVDIRIAVDMVLMAHRNAYDTAILVSGDGDFATLVRAVKDFGKNVLYAYFTKLPAYHLKQVCDDYVPLDEEILKPFIL